MKKTTSFKILKALVLLYITVMIFISLKLTNPLLGALSLLVGIVFIWFMKRKMQVKDTDERLDSIAGKAGMMTYLVMASALSFFSLLLLFLSLDLRDPIEASYLRHLGVIFSYLTMVMIGLYAFFYKLYSRM